MSFDNSGADYLRRLKQTEERPEVVHGAMNAPLQEEPRVTAQPWRSEAPSTQERRRSPRYKCEGSAQFRTEGSDVKTWGTFTDLSLNGCYVEMTATYPVGGTVDLLLELNGIRVKVRGEVRVSYPCLGMGIAFREMSAEDRAQLVAMVQSLSASAIPVRGAQEPLAGNSAPPASMPVITNAVAAVQALANYFEGHVALSKEDFVRILRKSQGADDLHDNWR